MLHNIIFITIRFPYYILINEQLFHSFDLSSISIQTLSWLAKYIGGVVDVVTYIYGAHTFILIVYSPKVPAL